MITFFPTPYEDEILYSVFARYHSKSPNINGSETSKDLFNARRVVCTIEFPSMLAKLLQNMPYNHPYNVERLVANHTLFSYYTAFLSPENGNLIRQYMIHKNVEIYNKITSIINPLAEHKFLRFCPHCNEETLNKYGETYWRRIHQIRGIYICPIHKTPIYNSSVSIQENKYTYIAATQDNCNVEPQITYNLETYNKLLMMSEDIYYILHNSAIKTDIKEQYANQLKILKYATTNGGLRQRDLICDFESFWGKEVLEITNNTITKTNNSNWLLEMGWSKPMTSDPIKHILFLRFLGLNPYKVFNDRIEFLPFGSPPYPCLNPVCGDYKKEVIKSIEVKNSYKTKSPIGYFTCPECGFSYLRRGPDKEIEDKYRYSRIVDYGDYWREKLITLLRYYSVPKTAKIMGTTHTTIYDYLKRRRI